MIWLTIIFIALVAEQYNWWTRIIDNDQPR